MTKNTKIAVVVLAVVLFLGVLAFALENKRPQTSQAPAASSAPVSSANNANNPASGAQDNLSQEPMPQPTGKVDDTVNAIIDGANKEGAQATSDEQDAASATDNTNSQAVNDLGAGL